MAVKVEFLVDEKGRRKSVLMSYRAYMELMEDLADVQAIAERRDDPMVSLEEVKARLKNAGRI